MRIRLKGLNSITKRLADGTRRTYWYAWKGGPALRGEPGTPEFIASYNEAAACKVMPPARQALECVASVSGQRRFPRPRAALALRLHRQDQADRESVRRFPALGDDRHANTRNFQGVARTAGGVIPPSGRLCVGRAGARTVLRYGSRPCSCKSLCAWRTTLSWLASEKIWTVADEAAFLELAPAHLHLPLLLALWTGQRQGDLLRLPWSAYDGKHIRLRQSKTGARVVIPVGAPLKAALDATPKRSTIILTNSDGKPWTPDGFRASWGKACKAAGVVGVTFHDLRGTAVTRLALAECTEAEIVTITGHSLRSVRAIIDTHYLSRDPALGESAIRKLEKRTKTPN